MSSQVIKYLLQVFLFGTPVCIVRLGTSSGWYGQVKRHYLQKSGSPFSFCTAQFSLSSASHKLTMKIFQFHIKSIKIFTLYTRYVNVLTCSTGFSLNTVFLGLLLIFQLRCKQLTVFLTYQLHVGRMFLKQNDRTRTEFPAMYKLYETSREQNCIR